MIDFKTTKDIEFLIKYCEKKNDIYYHRAVDSTIRHDAGGTEHEPTKQLFKDVKKCERAIKAIKQLSGIGDCGA